MISHEEIDYLCKFPLFSITWEPREHIQFLPPDLLMVVIYIYNMYIILKWKLMARRRLDNYYTSVALSQSECETVLTSFLFAI